MALKHDADYKTVRIPKILYEKCLVYAEKQGMKNYTALAKIVEAGLKALEKE